MKWTFFTKMSIVGGSAFGFLNVILVLYLDGQLAGGTFDASLAFKIAFGLAISAIMWALGYTCLFRGFFPRVANAMSVEGGKANVKNRIVYTALFIFIFPAVIYTAYWSPATTMDDTVQYEMAPAHDGDFLFPKITKFHDPIVMASVNKQLQDISDGLGCYDVNDSIDDLRSEAEADSDVITGQPASSTAEIDTMNVDQLKRYINSHTSPGSVDAKVTYAANDIFSVQIIMTEDGCGGAHPTDYENDSATFDLSTGDQISFEDLFSNYDKDQSAIVGPILSDMSVALSKGGGDPECVAGYRAYIDDGAEFPFPFEYVISGTNLIIEPVFNFASTACTQSVSEPIEKFAKYYDASSILIRVE